MIKSAYIHIPFCETICSYCDFCKYYYRKEWADDYLNALEEEIRKRYQKEELATLYIGGGTPSALTLEQLDRLFSILSRLNLSKEVEYTVECNIENITEEKISLFRNYGVNRVSVGIQTFQEKHLAFLNRKHTKQEAIEKILMIKKYIPNVNIDLIYAIPGSTMEDLEADLDCFLSLDIPHLSTYSLIIEKHTQLYNHRVEPVAEELDLAMYEKIKERLKDYHHYEISNFAKEGYTSSHNLTYWNNEEYYGFGLGASGYIGDIRYTNTRSLTEYGKGNWVYEEQALTDKEKMENEFILGLRKIEGISISKFQKLYHQNPLEMKVVQTLLTKNLLCKKDDFLFIPEQYLYISNDILIHFLDLEE